MSIAIPTGDIINYNFEGLVGPQGIPGPPGPQAVGTPVLGPVSSVSIPSYVLDDGATPGTPTGLTATAAIQYILLEWNANTETDMDRYEIWRHTSDVSGDATKISDAYQTLMVDGNLTAGQIYYYWVKAVDHLGNTSGFSSSVNGTPRDVGTTDIQNSAIEANQIATNAIEEAKVAADAITAAKIAVAGLDGTSGDVAANHIVAGMLQTDSVTSAKIQADAVTATKINVVGLDGATGRIIVADATDADAVTGGINTHASTLIQAGKIVISGATNLDNWADVTEINGGAIKANSISGSQNQLEISALKVLIDGEVLLSDWRKGGDVTKIDGGKISADTITVDQMAANSITAVNGAIANLTVDTLQIAGLAVETAKIDNDATAIEVTAETAAETGYIAITWPGEEVEDATITSIGGIIEIQAFVDIHNYYGSTKNCYGRILAGAVTLAEDFVQIASGADGRLSLFVLDTPGSGSQTYDFQLRSVQTTAHKASNAQIRLRESKGK